MEFPLDMLWMSANLEIIKTVEKNHWQSCKNHENIQFYEILDFFASGVLSGEPLTLKSLTKMVVDFQ